MTHPPEFIEVLTVDDEPAFADITRELVERQDQRITVETANDMREGLARLSDRQFDCIVSDYELPRQNGIDLLETVRREHPELPFILFTGKGSEEIASEAISAGVSDYLQKESGTDQFALLANRIANLVRKHRAEERLAAQAERRQRSEQYRQQLLEITTAPDTSSEEKTRALLELGCERLGTTDGCLTKIDEESQCQEVVSVYGEGHMEKGFAYLPETYCRRTIESDTILDIYNAPAEGWEQDPAYQQHGLGCYIGRKLLVEDELYGTLCFVSPEPRATPFTSGEKTFFDLLSRWCCQLLERKRRKTQLAAMFEHTRDGMMLIDVSRDGRFQIRRVNRTFEDWTGLTSAELYGAPLRTVMGDENPDNDEIEARYRTCVDRRESIEFRELSTVDGQTRYWHTRLAPVIEDDRVIQIIRSSHDITRQMKHKHELERQNDRLDEFAGMVSHDLRSPLNVAVTRLELARRACDTGDLEKVKDAHERMATLIDDVLTVARQGRTVTDTEPVDLAALFKRAWHNVETAGAVPGVVTERSIQADRARLQRILENLIRNAVEHAGDQVMVTIGDLPDGFYIEDDGVGLPEDEREQIFESGYSTAEAGTGFGLRIVREIAGAHGWQIRVTEGADGGARFEISGVEFVS